MPLPSPGPGQDIHPSLLELLGFCAEEQSQVALGDLEGMPSLQAVTWLREGDVEADQRHAALRFHVLDGKIHKINILKHVKMKVTMANQARSKLTSVFKRI